MKPTHFLGDAQETRLRTGTSRDTISKKERIYSGEILMSSNQQLYSLLGTMLSRLLLDIRELVNGEAPSSDPFEVDIRLSLRFTRLSYSNAAAKVVGRGLTKLKRILRSTTNERLKNQGQKSGISQTEN
jgi:hypothetical protein